MEKKLYHRGRTLELYAEPDGATGVYCSQLGSDGTALVLFCSENKLVDAFIPGIWWMSHKDHTEEETNTYTNYLREHDRDLCHFALDLFFDHSAEVTLKVSPSIVLQATVRAAGHDESPQRYLLRTFREFIAEDIRESKDGSLCTCTTSGNAR